ncbi:hypothetical protein D4R71_07610 [bacterium]|nr:MAG: hypothetical protein D4R71_07610 [bacterium]
MDIVNKKCPICGSPTYQNVTGSIGKMIVDEVNCYRCGHYIIEHKLSYDIDNLETNQIVNISGWIRENQGSDILIDIDEKKLESLMSPTELTMFEKADKILQYLARQFPVAGTKINYQFNKVREILAQIKAQEFPVSKDDGAGKTFYKNTSYLLPLMAIGRIIDGREFDYIWEDYLINEKHYISKEPKISPAGWAYLETFRHPNPDSKKAFVAMWFTDEMKEILKKYIKPAAKEAGGYKAEPIDEKDYNGDINDAIIGEIRNSKFVIADFTGNRGGVYYEAGFADGLNIPVIYSCKKEWFNKFIKQNIKIKDSKGHENEITKNIYSQIHFDVNHPNFIVWKDGDDLYKKLLNKIKATIV